jgi:anion-transporting  ArsA/GET3 family ATPase
VTIEELLAGKRVLVCAGPGGVGKTTAAAAIGLGMARRGCRALVVTIDPARRLAGALGMRELAQAVTRVDLAAIGVEADGELWATMLDPKATFDDLVRRQAPTPEAAERILANRIYGQISSAGSGAHEYMAVERLYELHRADRFDLIILDTPPTHNALDFLDAPTRVTRFVEGRALRFLVRPGVRAGGFGLRALGNAPAMAFALIERLVGTPLISEVGEFAAAFDGMYEGFRDRAQEAAAVLASPQTAFLVVTVPQHEPIADAERFWRVLEERDLPFGGVVVNKVHPDEAALAGRSPAALRAATDAELAASGLEDEGLRRRAVDNLLHYVALAGRDRAEIERLATRLGGDALLEVPYLDHDVHDLRALVALGDYLFAARPGRAARH